MGNSISREASASRDLALSTAGKRPKRFFNKSGFPGRASAREPRADLRHREAAGYSSAPRGCSLPWPSLPRPDPASGRTRIPRLASPNPTRDLALATPRSLSKQGSGRHPRTTRSDTRRAAPLPAACRGSSQRPSQVTSPLVQRLDLTRPSSGHASSCNGKQQPCKRPKRSCPAQSDRAKWRWPFPVKPKLQARASQPVHQWIQHRCACPRRWRPVESPNISKPGNPGPTRNPRSSKSKTGGCAVGQPATASAARPPLAGHHTKVAGAQDRHLEGGAAGENQRGPVREQAPRQPFDQEPPANRASNCRRNHRHD